MGRISRFVCPSCDRSWEVRLGHGMEHALLENVLDEFPPDIRQKILTDTKGEQDPSFEFNYCPAVCWRCQKIAAVPLIYLHKAGRTYTAACPDCGNPVTVLAEDREPLCPCCGKGMLSAEETGRWD